MNFCNILQIANNVQRYVIREYAFKSNLKIKWVRPEKIPCIKPEKSGDLSKVPPIDPNEFLVDFKNSKELQSADPMVQSLFTLGSNRSYETTKFYRTNLIKEVQRHHLDYGSMESKLARMTSTIRRYQDHMDKFPRDRNTKVRLKELIDKRKKFLKYLRRWDYPRFEWILEKLDLLYKPPPAKFHWITRKESLQKLTDKYCDEIKEQRLAEYRKHLESQQITFLEDAIKKLQFVRSEQIDLEIPITVTEEIINEYKEELDKVKQKDVADKKEEEDNRSGSYF